MLVKLMGRFTSFKFIQEAKALAAILVKFSGKVIFSKLIQSEKAPSLILVRLSGSVIFVKLLQYLKAILCFFTRFYNYLIASSLVFFPYFISTVKVTSTSSSPRLTLPSLARYSGLSLIQVKFTPSIESGS